MTYLVVDNCIKCKHMDCVTVCPVDCFYEGENMLVINPDECIDCGICEDECPANAIVTDTSLESNPDELEKWMDINTKYSELWPVITTINENRPSIEEREEWDGVPNKYENHFSKEPAKGK